MRAAVLRRTAFLVAFALLAVLARLQAPAAAAMVYPVPESIPADCSRDVETELNSFIASVPDGQLGANGPDLNVITFKAGGCYKIADTLLVSRRAYLRLDGNNATINGTAIEYHRLWRVQWSHHVYLSDMRVEGGNPDPGGDVGPHQWSAGVKFEGSHDVGVDRVQVHNAYGDGFIFAPGWDGKTPVNSYNGHVRDSVVEGCGRMGIAATGGHDYAWENNTVRNCPWIFDLELEWARAGFYIEDVTIARNRTGAFRLVWLANAGQCNAGRGNIVVRDNVMEVSGSGWPPVTVQNPDGCSRRGPYTITGNLLRTRGKHGIGFWGGGVHDVLIRANTIVVEGRNTPRDIASIHRSARVRVLDNCLYNGTQIIEVIDSEDVVEEGNRLDCNVPFTTPARMSASGR